MKRLVFSAIPVLLAFLLCLACIDVFARGFGGGRGGAGFGGSYRGAGAMHHSPSMSSYSGSRSLAAQSRPRQSTKIASRPSGPSSPGKQAFKGTAQIPSSGRRIEGRPSEAQIQHFLNMPEKGGRGLSDLGKAGIGAAAGALGYAGAQHLLGMEGRGGGEHPRVADRHAGERPSTLPSKPNADRIRENFQSRHDNVFTPQWWKDHPHAAHAYWDKHRWNYWWRPATWVALGTWIAGASWSSPTYYDYGTNIYYEGDQVYDGGGSPVATAEEYYQQANDIATSAPEVPQQDAEWLPLGVFALSRDEANDSNMVLQLAVDKDGVIAGTYYNAAIDKSRPVKGMVDKQTQRAAWTFADGKNTDIIMETGIANLTQDQTEALVHFGKDNTQKWLMVRLKQPQEDTRPGTEG